MVPNISYFKCLSDGLLGLSPRTLEDKSEIGKIEQYPCPMAYKSSTFKFVERWLMKTSWYLFRANTCTEVKIYACVKSWQWHKHLWVIKHKYFFSEGQVSSTI